MRDSMVLYRSFIDSIVKLETQFDAETALKLFKAVAYYGIDGVIDEDMDPLIDLLFTNIKPQIDANTKRFTDGKKGGRPKKTTGNADTKPKVSNKKTTGYETKKPLVIDNKTIGYENENLRLSDKKPNVNVNDNVNVNLNENVNEDIEKTSLSFSYDKIENPELLKLEEYEKKASVIVSLYFDDLNFEPEDFMVYSEEKIKKADIDISFPMKRLNRAFLTYIYKMNINSIQVVQVLIKSVLHTNGSFTSKFIIDKITECIQYATQNNYKRFYLENIKQ